MATDVCSVPGADAPIIDVNSASRTNFNEDDTLVVNPAVNRIQDLKGSWPRVFERRRVALFAVRNDIYLLFCNDKKIPV